ncbi:hypothetical protein HUG15_07465 [Salicibibacter cibarius]|uniref:Uncharacterized protein n=2 Tax=Bacillaceae TaxID=186817 RepID=A0A1G8Q0M1_9BACI|nr:MULTISPECIES: hypothetical protein [Bacillaceae]QQK75434.1 hypothetical protein HUG15_07465 [Salicibibacter cibarius]SDI98247.1 hypothetical protein SAMN04488123_11045 [Natribacillus halophilus]
MVNQPLISQVSAILIEHAREQGVSELQLQRAIRDEDVDFLNKVSGEHFKYDELFAHAYRYGEDLERALLQGYQMNFNTLEGLQIWLMQKFGFEEGVSYQIEKGEFKHIVVKNDILQTLESRLATNWTVVKNDEDEEQKEHDVSLQLNTWF